MITREEIEYLAKLARIDVAEEEKDKIQKDIGNILEYVKKLEEVDVSQVLPTAHALDILNSVRDDSPVPESSSEKVHERRDILESFPEEENGYLKIKEIFQ